MDEPLGEMVNHVSRLGDAVVDASDCQYGFLNQSRTSVIERLWASINGHPRGTLAGIVVFYLLVAIGQAATKLLWCDELITLAIARRGNFAGIWSALAGGADPNPPLSHWMVLESTRAFGQGAFAVRLPAILCVLLAIVSMWMILRRWVCPGYAAVGVIAFMATRGFDYAYDARSYGPLMGFGLASLALWLAACDAPESGQRWPPQNGVRLAALTGMAGALALGLSSNYYGVLAFVPIGAGEVMRTVRTRRLEADTWLAMAAAALPLIGFLTLVRHNLAEFGPHAWNRPQAGMVVDSYLVLVEGVFWPVLALGAYAAWECLRRRARHEVIDADLPGRALQPYEATALAVLLLYPVLGFAVAVAGHGMISPRCVAPVCCGFGIAAGLLGRKVFGTSARAGAIVLAVALLWVAARESACSVVLAEQRKAFFEVRDQLARQSGTRPIAVGDSLVVLPLAYYSTEPVRARIVFPIDFDAIHRFEADDSGEQNLWAGRFGVFPIRIAPYVPGLFGTGEFTVVVRPEGWLARRLTGDGFRLEQLPQNPAWQSLGGVFTPLDHEGTRLMRATR